MHDVGNDRTHGCLPTAGMEETLTHDNNNTTPKKVYFSVDGNSEIKSTTQPTGIHNMSS